MKGPRETRLPCGSRRTAREPPQIARVKIGRPGPAVAIDDGRQRAAFGMREPKRHVTVLFGIMRRLGRFEQCIECRRRLGRIAPVTLRDRGALGNQPAVAGALDAVEKTRKRGEVGLDCVEFLPPADNHRRLGDRAILVQPDRRGEQVMARPAAARGKTGAGALDELLERAAKPRHGNMPVGRKRAAQLLPFALVPIETPGLDEFGDRGFIGKFHWTRLPMRLARGTISYSMIPKKLAPDLIRGGYRFPACAKPS